MTNQIMKYFAFEHLPPHLQEVSRPIGELAKSMDDTLPDGAEKTALAIELFGKSGADLIPFLNQGREGVGALTAELQDLGVQIGGDGQRVAAMPDDPAAAPGSPGW